MSCPANPLDCATGIVGGTIGSAATSAWDQVCKSFADAASQLLGAFGKAFVAIPPVNLGSAGVRNVYAISLGLAGVIAALLLFGQVIRTAATHDGSGLAQGLTGVGKAALGFLLTLTIAGTALEAADQLTRFIVTETFGSVQALSGRIGNLVAWNVSIQGATLLLFGVIGILLTIVLWFELLLRNAAIAVLVATSPIAAAGQVSEVTKSWWPKLAAATAQLIILKPVIALVFCLGFSLTGTSHDVETLLSGLLVLLLAVIAWPAIARFFTFAAAQVGGGAGLGAMVGFAAGRLTSGTAAPAGIEPDEFSRRIEARNMAGLEAADLGVAAPSPAVSAAVRRMPATRPAAVAAVAATTAQRAANALTGRMEQMAGHAGIPGANPYAQPAGPPRYAGHPIRRTPLPADPGTAPGPALPVGPPPRPAGQGPAGTAWRQERPGSQQTPPPDAGTQPQGQPQERSAPPSPSPPPPEIHHEPPSEGPADGGNDTDGGTR